MTYNPSIPQSTDLISVSQGQLLTNFGQLNSQFGGSTPTTGGDHDGFNNGSGNGSGMHNQVTFTANQAAPSLTRNLTAGVSGLYPRMDSIELEQSRVKDELISLKKVGSDTEVREAS